MSFAPSHKNKPNKQRPKALAARSVVVVRCVGVVVVVVVVVVVAAAAAGDVELVRPVSVVGVRAQGGSRAALGVRTPHPLRVSWLSHTTPVTTVMARQPHHERGIREPSPVGLLAECEVSSGRRTVEISFLSPDCPSLWTPLLAQVPSSARACHPSGTGRPGSLQTGT